LLPVPIDHDGFVLDPLDTRARLLVSCLRVFNARFYWLSARRPDVSRLRGAAEKREPEQNEKRYDYENGEINSP